MTLFFYILKRNGEIQLEPSFLVTQCISLQFRWNLMETVNNKKFAWQEEKFVSETEQMAETKT